MAKQAVKKVEDKKCADKCYTEEQVKQIVAQYEQQIQVLKDAIVRQALK